MKRDVRLVARTRLPQKLVAEAARAGICLTEASCDGDCLRVCLSPSNARAFRDLCARYALPVDVASLRGGGAVIAFLRRRRTLTAALIAFALVINLLLGRIWRVDVAFTGSAAALGDPACIRAALDELGVRPGCPASLDTDRLAGALAARVTGCSYIGARRQGVRLLVTAVPESPAPEVYALDAARDVRARHDGIVVSVNVRAGVPCVAPGDTVRRGQLLIRGEEQDRGDTSRPIAALGEVVLRTWVTGTASLPTTRIVISYTGNYSYDHRLSILGRDISLLRGRRFGRQTVEVETLPVVGLFLPVEIHRETRREVREQTVPVNEGQLKARVGALAQADAAARLEKGVAGDFEIVRRWTDFETTDGGKRLRARAVIEITTDTAATRKALYLGG